MTAADEALTALGSISVQKIRNELETLRAVNDWAIRSLKLGYQPGDQVVIVSEEPSDVRPGSGWYPHRESLRIGRVGVAEGITFNRATGWWTVGVLLDGDLFSLHVDWVQKAGDRDPR